MVKIKLILKYISTPNKAKNYGVGSMLFHVWSVNVRKPTIDRIKAALIDNLVELITIIDKNIFFINTH